MARHYLYLYGGAIGDALLGIHIGRYLAEREPGAKLELVSTRKNRFVGELAKELPFIKYVEILKEAPSTWFTLLSLIVRRNAAVVYEPVSSDMPAWWKLILWSATRMPGSIALHFQMRDRERPVPRTHHSDTYSSEESFFDTPPRVLSVWGITVEEKIAPTLPRLSSPLLGHYILFHFFAGHYRRSIPVYHARAILASARVTFPQTQFVVTCAANEENAARRMIEGMSNVQLEVAPSAHRMFGLISGAEMVVGTASGILLIAAHVSVKTIALSCLIYTGWLPTFNPCVTILAARGECECVKGHPERCSVMTPEGEVFRCLYFIPTEAVIAAMVHFKPALP